MGSLMPEENIAVKLFDEYNLGHPDPSSTEYWYVDPFTDVHMLACQPFSIWVHVKYDWSEDPDYA